MESLLFVLVPIIPEKENNVQASCVLTSTNLMGYLLLSINIGTR